MASVGQGRIALVTAVAARDVDEDLPLITQAVARADATARVDIVDWDDPLVEWAGYGAVVVRSTWDYTTRIDEFRSWVDRVAAVSRLANPAALIRWNSDKRYLADLATQGVAVIDATFVAPGQGAELPDSAEVVVKPVVGAGSRDAGRYRRSDTAGILAHVARLHDRSEVAMIQPYISSVDRTGEAGLFFFGGVYSHAITKGPLLRLDAAPTRALFAPEQIGSRQASAVERAAAESVLAALPHVSALSGAELPPLYARVDLLADDVGTPVLLELEVCEPSLFLATSPGAADRYVATVLEFASRR